MKWGSTDDHRSVNCFIRVWNVFSLVSLSKMHKVWYSSIWFSCFTLFKRFFHALQLKINGINVHVLAMCHNVVINIPVYMPLTQDMPETTSKYFFCSTPSCVVCTCINIIYDINCLCMCAHAYLYAQCIIIIIPSSVIITWTWVCGERWLAKKASTTSPETLSAMHQVMGCPECIDVKSAHAGSIP